MTVVEVSVIDPADHFTICPVLMKAALWDVSPTYDGDTADLAGLPALYHCPESIELLLVGYTEDEEPIAALAVGTAYYRPTERSPWNVLHCYVREDHRRQGIADRMLTHARLTWEAEGHDWSKLMGFHNPMSGELYLRHGLRTGPK